MATYRDLQIALENLLLGIFFRKLENSGFSETQLTDAISVAAKTLKESFIINPKEVEENDGQEQTH
jgi:hypothetical protein